MKKALEISKLKVFAEELNNDIRALLQDKSSSNDIMTLLSCILLALENKDFRRFYKNYKYDKLAEEILKAIENLFNMYKIPLEKQENLIHYFKGLMISQGLKEINEKLGENILRFIIDKIVENVIHIKEKYKDIDILATFYSEIIKYTVGEGKGGFVLTPYHITKLFSELADLTPCTKVLDICAGTGVFLISAMSSELEKAKGNVRLERNIKKSNFYGVEIDSNRYIYAYTNMIIRGACQTNIYNEDCFKIEKELKNIGAEVGFMNPPYSSDKGYKGPSELEFVKYLLICLKRGGRAIVIVPKSCAKERRAKTLKLREEILQSHTLEAVMSMPEGLFGRDAGVDTCIMIFRAKEPHSFKNKVWLANWADDGYILKRNKGRVDEKNKFETQILPSWVKMFKNKEEISKVSMKKELKVSDEWLYASHAELSYEDLNRDLFAKRVKELALFMLSNDNIFEKFKNDFNHSKVDFKSTSTWGNFKLVGKDALFQLEKFTNNLVTRDAKEFGETFFISAAAKNNGCIGYIDSVCTSYLHRGNCLTIAKAGQSSIGLCNYQPFDFVTISTVHVLRPLFNCNSYIGIFVATVLQLIREFRTFGQAITKKNIFEMDIKLPIDKNGNPDWDYMEEYIKSFPYSSVLQK